MYCIKMRFVNTVEFDKALIACQMAFGVLAIKKRTLIWIVCFEQDDVNIVRDTLETEGGSSYAGRWHL